jgi:hypothetical protein
MWLAGLRADLRGSHYDAGFQWVPIRTEQMLDHAANGLARWGGDTVQRWFEAASAERGEAPERGQ